MIQINPAILSDSIEDVRKKIELITGMVQMVHIDIMDSTLTTNKTILVSELAGIYFPMEIHLMVANPLLYKQDLRYVNPVRVIIHQEIEGFDNTFAELKEDFSRVCVAQLLDSYTPINFDEVMFMAVNIGAQGQSFSFSVSTKLRQYRIEHPDSHIEIDGGIDDITAKFCRVQGADCLAVGSYIWKDFDKDIIREKITKLSYV